MSSRIILTAELAPFLIAQQLLSEMMSSTTTGMATPLPAA
jgi:hypothetical protein